MFSRLVLLYTILSSIIIVIDFYMAYLSLKDNNNYDKVLFAVLSINAGLVAFVYLISVLLKNYTYFSIVTSIYFILISTLLLNFLIFISSYIDKQTINNNIILKILAILVIMDAVSLILNPIFEHAVSYVFRPNVALSHYRYSMKFFYNCHLVLTYGMVVGITVTLAIQASKSAKEYKAVYGKPLLWILLLVALNAVFLFRNGNTLFDLVDISIIGYSVILIIIYISFFSYGQRDVKKELALKVFDKLDKHIFIFDEKGYITMRDKSTDLFISSMKLPKIFTLQEFIEQSGIPIYQPYKNTKDSFSYDNRLYDYSFQILDEDTKIAGYLIVLSKEDNIKDDLTNCYYPEYFNNIYRKSFMKMGKPICVTTFDIISLGLINMMFSYRQGNDLILSLLDSIKTIFPENKITIIRSSGAKLTVITFGLTKYELDNYISNVINIFEGKLVTSTVIVDKDDIDIESYINKSLEDIQKEKSNDDRYSKTINSLLTYYSKLNNDYLHIISRMNMVADFYAKEINLTDEEVNKLHTLILCCEVGMIGLPSALVLKANPNIEEISVLNDHTLRGYKISFSDPQLKEIADEILYHHENYDGSGYPYAVRGEEIPFIARILRIIYDFDYYINNDKLTLDEALRKILDNSNIIYDPKLVPAFIKAVNQNKDEILKEF